MTGSTFRSINPATGIAAEEFLLHTPEEIDRALARAYAAHRKLKEISPEDRSAYLYKLGEKLEENATAFGRTITLEMGKPSAEAVAEVQKCALVCRYFAKNGPRLLEEQAYDYPDIQATVRKDPLGLVLAIMPWNFPFWQVFRFGAPALMAGNTVVLKHAPNVPGCARAIHDLAAEVLPGLIENIFVGTESVSSLIARPEIQAVTLTGSTAAGRSVAAQAGRALKKTVLELGGSDPAIVLPDCELYRAADQILQSRLLNAGQSCIATKRIFVHEDIAEPFTASLKELLSKRTIGPGLDVGVDLGPLARADLRDNLERQLRESFDQGAQEYYRLPLPGNLAPGGFFSAPVIVYPCPPNVPAWQEETFGPLIAVRTFRTEEEAVTQANDSLYGLGASIYTKDSANARRLAARLDTGNVFLNTFVKSDPRLPFGGVKQSGYGRELGFFGIHEFVNVKTVAE